MTTIPFRVTVYDIILKHKGNTINGLIYDEVDYSTHFPTSEKDSKKTGTII